MLISKKIIFSLFAIVIILVYILHSKVNNIEYGSVSDWINTLGTLGTLYVAYTALQRAPDWLSQKHYDIAYNIIENAVFKDLNKLRSSSLHLKTKMVTLHRKLNQIMFMDMNTSALINDMLDAVQHELDEYHRSSYEIINQLKSISRTDYELTDYSNDLITIIKKTSYDYNESYNYLYLFTNDFESPFYSNEQQKIASSKEEVRIRNSIIGINTLIYDTINTILEENKPINHFIINKNKRK